MSQVQIRLSLAGTASVLAGLEQLRVGVAAFSRSLTTTALGLVGVGGLTAGLGAIVKAGVGFNATLETAKLGIAAIQKQFNPGAFKDFNSAMLVSGKVVDLLKQKAKESPATFEELVTAFQGISGAATSANIPLEKQVDLIVLMSQALSGLGIRSDQILQESRALLTGNINENAAAARILGITKADIDSARESGMLFEFLTEKLSAFSEAGKVGASSFNTLWSNVKDSIQQASAAATIPIFDELKKGMTEILTFDWEGLGKQIGELIALGLAEWRGGSLDRFIAVSVGAGFEASVEILREQLMKFFGADGGIETAIKNTFVRAGFYLRKVLLEAVWDAFETLYQTLALLAKTTVPYFQKRVATSLANLPGNRDAVMANLEAERKAAFEAMGMTEGNGRTYRDQLQAMLADRRSSQPAAEPVDLAPMTVHGNMYAGAPQEGPMPLHGDASSFQQNFSVTLVRLRAEWGTWASQAAQAFENVFNSAISTISDGISGLIMGTKSWGAALREIGTSILTTVVQSIVQMGVRWVLTRIMMATVGRAIQAAETAAALAVASSQAGALAGIWATPATLATTASFGEAAAMAPAAIAAATAAVKGSSIAMSAFASGGLTPGRPTLAMVGERGPEMVINAEATKRNLSALQAINNGADIGSVSGGGGGGGRPVNVNVFFDRSEWLRANQDDIEAIAHDAFRRTARA